MWLALCTLSFLSFDPNAGTRSPLAPAGDLDGDGVPDLWVAGRGPVLQHGVFVGWRSEGEVFGHVFALSGRDGSVLLHLTGDPADELEGRTFGRALAPAGDVDGDGIPDLLVAAGSPVNGRGAVELRSGADGSKLWRIDGEREGDFFGFCIAGGEDFDGDCIPDVLVAAPGDLLSGARGEPAAFVHSGRTGAPLPLLHSDDGKRTHRLPGAARSVAALPDLDGDVVPDLTVGACVRSGRDGRVLFEPELGDWASGAVGDVDGDGLTDIFLSAIDREVTLRSGWDGALIRRWAGKTGMFANGEGFTVSMLGDVDGDGVTELAIGANELPFLDFDPGRARVVSGATGECLWTRLEERASGHDVQGVGDTDGDGIGDLALVHFNTQVVELVSCVSFETRWKVSMRDLLAEDDSR